MRKKYLQDMGEHWCACSCLGNPWDVEEAEKMMPTTQVSTNMLAHVLGIRAVLKRDR